MKVTKVEEQNMLNEVAIVVIVKMPQTGNQGDFRSQFRNPRNLLHLHPFIARHSECPCYVSWDWK